MRKLLIALVFTPAILSGCIYIQVFPAAPGPDKVQPPPAATFNAVPVGRGESLIYVTRE